MNKEGAAGILRLTLTLKDAREGLLVNPENYAAKLMIQTQVNISYSQGLPMLPTAAGFSWPSAPSVSQLREPPCNLQVPTFGETHGSL